MRIARCEVRSLDAALTRPYAIAGEHTARARLFLVVLSAEDGRRGLGTATPVESITGESEAACLSALSRARWLEGADVLDVHVLTRRLEQELPHAPAARAALDMALHDLWARVLEGPLVDLLGRAHRELPTSVTIGISDVATTLAEARRLVARGFRVLKVKTGESLDEDVRRLAALREEFPAATLIADANAGYEPAEVPVFVERTRELELALIEQPVPREALDELRSLPAGVRARLAADESLLDERDVPALLREPRPFGVWNIKLMKCGGIAPALRLAARAKEAGIGLMWGCMDESVVGIAAALHSAYAASATRFLDLDGSFDLAEDFARGGFELVGDRLRTLPEHGLGARLI